jgi:hypothetical protein
VFSDITPGALLKRAADRKCQLRGRAAL